ncbi:glycerophosphodiester phosphodiesterase family protein [Alteraurantiacibacter aestuarii]
MPWRLIDRLRAPAPDPDRVGWMLRHVFAHRALHGEGRAENSPAAFRAAMDAGLGIECDVRRSRDGRAVVFHDATLERLTGSTGEVDRMVIGELTHVALSVGGETIPTLRDMLELVAGKVPILLELKSDPDRQVNTLCRAVRRDLEGYQGDIAVMSFDPRIGQWFARKMPQVLRGLVVTEQEHRTYSGTIRRHRDLWTARAQFLAYDIRDLPSSFAARQRARGLPVLSWTVSSRALRERAQNHADAPIAEGEGLA